jgi:predicted CXXCH cytochrome family protein
MRAWPGKANPERCAGRHAGRVKRLRLFCVLLIVAVSLTGCATENRPVAPAGQQGTFPFYPLTPSSPEARYKVLSFFFDGVPKPEEKTAGTPGEQGSGESRGAGSARHGSVHGPYAAKMCYGCHDPASHSLLLPVRELCLKCHVFKMNKKYIHGPLVSGGCIVCHDPHSSPNRFLLVSREQTFCYYCHAAKDIEKNPAHKDIDATQCTSCHDGHMSNKRYMLK